MAEDAMKWLEEHLWVPILVGSIILLLLTALLIWLIYRCRHYRRFDYTVLREDMALPDKLKMQKKMELESIRDNALMNCQYYLRSKGTYMLIEHLNEIGNRVNTHWFMVADTRTRSEHILTMLPKPTQMALPFISSTRKLLAELFLLLQHPFLYPVAEVDFVLEQELVMVVHHFYHKGSLKDLIYHSKCLDPWASKYSYRYQGMPVKQVQTFGKHILQALLFLLEKGLPPHGHLHSGNVYIENGVCRVSGYENTILGMSPRILPLVRKKLRDGNKEAIDSICFGHLLYEMSAGCVLDAPTPEPRHLVTCPDEVIKILNFIFHPKSGQIPSIQEIHDHIFFQFIRPRETAFLNPSPIHFSSAIKSLLKTVKTGKPFTSKSRRRSSKSSQRQDSSGRTSRQSSVVNMEIHLLEELNVPPPPPPPSFGAPLPPPPAPAVPAPGGPPSYGAVASSGRGALLMGIHQGTNLKKTVTNDRSAPKV